MEKIYLNVPFSQKDKAKRLGAKFDGDKKSWYIQDDLSLDLFSEWLPISLQSQSNQSNNGVPLYQFLKDISNTIRDAYNNGVWIEANINHIQINNHAYFELADDHSKIKGMMWNSSVSTIFSKFKSETGMELKEGQKILMKAIPTFHEKFGMSLEIIDINPTFTIGDMERKLNEIRNTLVKEGIYENNKKLKLPIEFTKVAVIAPSNAAGLGDFKTVSDTLENCQLCFFDFFNVQFQGIHNKTDFEKAFISIEKKLESYDAIVIIRGGGDKSGLYELNDINIARLICHSPLPVIVGIGHDRDMTILDELAAIRLPTPSMVINHISGTILSNGKRVLNSIIQSNRQIENSLKYAKQQLSSKVEESFNQISNSLKIANLTLDNKINESINLALLNCDRSKETLNKIVYESVYKNPQNVLNQGYSAITDEQGKMITSSTEVISNINIRFKDGIKKGVIV